MNYPTIYFIKNSPEVLVPSKNSNNFYDIFSGIETFVLYPGCSRKVSLRFKSNIPIGYLAKIFSRTGLTVTNGIEVKGAPMLVDNQFKGSWAIYLENNSNAPFTVKKFQKIAQMTIEKIEDINIMIEEDEEQQQQQQQEEQQGQDQEML